MNWIYETTLKNNKKIQFRTLNLEDINEILSLQNIVIDSLENKLILQPLSDEEYRYILDGKGIMVGAYDDAKLIAFRALMVPPIDNEHLGLDVGIDKSELKHVLYQEISNVHPNYRGNRLQQRLAKIIMDQFVPITNYKYICCTVAPFNIPSMKDKFRQRMQIAALKNKYDNRLRYIFVKNLAEATESDWKNTKLVDLSNIEKQKSLLSDGWRGLDMLKVNDKYKIKFGKNYR